MVAEIFAEAGKVDGLEAWRIEVSFNLKKFIQCFPFKSQVKKPAFPYF